PVLPPPPLPPCPPSTFPTRRSSDLPHQICLRCAGAFLRHHRSEHRRAEDDCPDRGKRRSAEPQWPRACASVSRSDCVPPSRTDRSEEHTSELQSRFDLVCRLLLEKK